MKKTSEFTSNDILENGRPAVGLCSFGRVGGGGGILGYWDTHFLLFGTFESATRHKHTYTYAQHHIRWFPMFYFFFSLLFFSDVERQMTRWTLPVVPWYPWVGGVPDLRLLYWILFYFVLFSVSLSLSQNSETIEIQILFSLGRVITILFWTLGACWVRPYCIYITFFRCAISLTRSMATHICYINLVAGASRPTCSQYINEPCKRSSDCVGPRVVL